MTAICHSSFRTVIAAVTHASGHGLRATRAQHLSLASPVLHGRGISTSSTRSSAKCMVPFVAHHAHSRAGNIRRVTRRQSRLFPNLKAERACLPQAQKLLLDLPFDTLLRILTPQTYEGAFLEAENLDEVLAGAADWAEPRLASAASQPGELRLALEKYLSDRHVNLDIFLSLRNAMISRSWPNARRHMINIADGKWPPHVLQRAIQSVVTPSEVSDSLALLASTIQHASMLPPSQRNATFRALRYCFVTLTAITLKDHGSAFHLIQQLTDVLLALLNSFPAQAASSEGFIYDFTRRCTGLSDERARQAVIRVMDWLRSEERTDKFGEVRHKVLGHCIHSVEVMMKFSRSKTTSSEQFANVELMEHLLHYERAADSDVQQRLLRCAVYIAGRGRDYRRTWLWFDEYQQFKQRNQTAVTGSDYLLLAKALARTEQGHKDAWRAFLRAERLLPYIAKAGPAVTKAEMKKQQQRHFAKELASTCVDLLQVMSKSTDVPIEKVLSMLGIFVQDSSRAGVAISFSSNKFSKTMKQRRADAYAYSVVMQGCLLRRQPKIAVMVWQAMLVRGVMPTTACLSILLQNLFQMQDVGSAMQHLHVWCEEGVLRPESTCDKLKDIEVESLATPALGGTRAPMTPAQGVTDKGVGRYKVMPDPVLASVVFSGLHSCGSNGIEALWSAYQQTIRLFPDAPVLALLLKASCQNKNTSRMDARFGRQVFRTLLFGKHPDLAKYLNPLGEKFEAHGTARWIFSQDTMGARMENWVASVFQAKEVESPMMPDDLSGLVFTSKLFEHYVRLLLHLQHSPGLLTDVRALRQELIDMLGWMKELNLKPTSTHLALTILEIEENLLPAMAGRQMDVLDAWLTDWLGPEGKPPEEQMQRHWQWKMERNGQRLGWFDQLSGPSETCSATNVE